MHRLQSAYRSSHSTETALMKVTGDILRILESGYLATLALLDLYLLHICWANKAHPVCEPQLE